MLVEKVGDNLGVGVGILGEAGCVGSLGLYPQLGARQLCVHLDGVRGGNEFVVFAMDEQCACMDVCEGFDGANGPGVVGVKDPGSPADGRNRQARQACAARPFFGKQAAKVCIACVGDDGFYVGFVRGGEDHGCGPHGHAVQTDLRGFVALLDEEIVAAEDILLFLDSERKMRWS